MGRGSAGLAALAGLAVLGTAVSTSAGTAFRWGVGTPESQGLSGEKLQALKEDLAARGTRGLLIARHDRIVFEWYAPGHGRHSQHYTASMAKALVGGVALAVALTDDRLALDDRVADHVPAWRENPLKARITVRHLGSHTSGLQDAWVAAEAARGVDQADFSGWEGEFWRWRGRSQPPPGDAFSLSRDRAPVLFPPGTDYAYSNPGLAMLGWVVTASLGSSGDIRTLLRERIMRPLGVPDGEWSCGYGKTEPVDGLSLVATWGGGSYSADAVARVARLMLRGGDWEGRRLLTEEAVRATVSDAGTPRHGGMGWWTNADGDLGRAPPDAFAAQGAGHQVVLVVPDLDLIAVRNGARLDPRMEYEAALRQILFDPILDSVLDAPEVAGRPSLPYPPSHLVERVEWAPAESIVRRAEGSDNWPLTWGDDDALYTAYGDGWGFEPRTERKLSLGLARVEGGASDFRGTNIRSPSGEQLGDGAEGRKASGMLMVDGVLYMWVRNAGNAGLAWSSDRGRSWTWSDWSFDTSFGAPTFLNFGRNYAGARDGFVYVYSHDSDSAYEAADGMVMARVPRSRLQDRAAWEFFAGHDGRGRPTWTRDAAARGWVFSHRGRCYRSGITWNAGLGRYLWSQVHPDSPHPRGPRFEGGFGVYEAPEPWGPWRTVDYTTLWDVGPGETMSFPSKWMSADGTSVHAVFSGDDHFSVRRVTLVLRPVEAASDERP
jgi:CubicO group peptidase (beta-lactamase class C family)